MAWTGYEERSWIGSGIVYIGPYDGSAKKRDSGNSSEVKLTIEKDLKEIASSRSPGGGIANSLDRVTGLAFSITMHDFTADNLATAIHGSVTAVSATTVTSEAHTAAYHDGLLPFDFMPDTTVAYVVKNTGATITYTLDDDYTETQSGIIPISTADGGTMVEGASCEVSYTKLASNTIKAMLNSGEEVAIFIEMKNEAQNDKAVNIDIYRVKLSSADELSFILDDYGNLTITGRGLIDPNHTVANGQYFDIDEDPA